MPVTRTRTAAAVLLLAAMLGALLGAAPPAQAQNIVTLLSNSRQPPRGQATGDEFHSRFATIHHRDALTGDYTLTTPPSD